MKPFLSNKGGAREKVVLVEGENIINDDAEIAQAFNDFFDNALESIVFSKNELLLTKIEVFQVKALDAIKDFEVHPSILKNKENVPINRKFSF